MSDRRPDPTEYAPYYGPYVDRVPDGSIIETLERQRIQTRDRLSAIPEARAGHRYAPGKWSLRELVAHVTDTERIFSTRALAFSRNDPAPWPGMDPDHYVEQARLEGRTLADLAAELDALRRSNIHLFRSFDAEILDRRGVASDTTFSVRAIPWLVAGHERHHMQVLQERYL